VRATSKSPDRRPHYGARYGLRCGAAAPTVKGRDEAAELIVERHSYDIPEVDARPVVAGSRDYLSLVTDSGSELR
jgi:hypothetical protein